MEQQTSRYARSLIEASLDPLVTLNTEGKIMDMNHAIVNLIGLKREQITGSDFFQYFTVPQNARKVCDEVFANGLVADSFLTLRKNNGKLTDVLLTGSVSNDHEGNMFRAVIVVRDIAEQKWTIELRTANKELAFQNNEKEKRAAELILANNELVFQNEEKEKRAAELILANNELVFQNEEKEKRAAELILANKELVFQNKEKEKRAAELIIANTELAFQNIEKEKRAAELIIANAELAFQNNEKEKRAAELIIANKELAYQNDEKEKRAAELILANKELVFQSNEKQKRVTESKELEALSDSLKLASEYTLSLIEASRDPLVTISPEGKITDMNSATADIVGMTREQLTGSDFFDYFTEPQKAREVYQEVFKEGSVADYPLTLRHINGKLTDVLFNGSVFKNETGEVLGAVVVARDVTDQKRIANELNEAKEFAEKANEVAQIAKENAQLATHKAEDAVKAKQQFLSNMSHEIRTPMNAIIGFTKVLLKTELNSKQKEYLTAIKMSGDALIVLINDILDLAKVDAGKMTFEQIPFRPELSISAMLHLFKQKFLEKNLKLEVDYDKNIPNVLLGDPVRLHQIILNLVSNAIKFTNAGSIKVSVKLLSENEEQAKLQFSVSDTGIGIDKDKLGTIFENFQQGSSDSSRLYGGTGLGLAIVKQLVEPQGGTIHVESELNKGSKFSFILDFPKTDKNPESELETMELNGDVKNIKVLVAEDVPLNQLLMKTILDEFHFECDIAENGKIAIEKLKVNDYDIILMDLQMPEMNGFDATGYIRNSLHLRIPIIALTADVTTVDLDKCKAVGMNDYIAKPVDEHLLYSKIVSLVKQSIALVEQNGNDDYQNIKGRYTDLVYLMQRTKSKPALMMEMISLYLEQTPPLVDAMKLSLENKDWNSLYSAVHKMIPSFTIMGIHHDIEVIAKKVQEFAGSQKQTDGISELVIHLENVCTQACKELETEYNVLKNMNP